MKLIVYAVIKALNDLCPGWSIEHRFSLKRRFRFDFACPDRRIAVEIDGGVWTYGRHVRGNGYICDMEKYNLAVVGGWRVLRYTPEQAMNGLMLDDIKMLLASSATKECGLESVDVLRA